MNIRFLTDAVKNLLPDNTPFNVNGATYAGIEILNDTVLPSEDAVMAEYARVEAAEPMRLLREERDRLIAETDWMANSDVTMSDAWRTYRQALRDLPANTTDPANPVWPTEPS